MKLQMEKRKTKTKRANRLKHRETATTLEKRKVYKANLGLPPTRKERKKKQNQKFKEGNYENFKQFSEEDITAGNLSTDTQPGISFEEPIPTPVSTPTQNDDIVADSDPSDADSDSNSDSDSDSNSDSEDSPFSKKLKNGQNETKNNPGALKPLLTEYIRSGADREELQAKLRERIQNHRLKRKADEREKPRKRVKVDRQVRKKNKKESIKAQKVAKTKKGDDYTPPQLVQQPKVIAEDLQFGVFDFGVDSATPAYIEEKKKRSATLYKSPKALLNQVKAAKEKLSKMDDKEKKRKIEETEAWEKAEMRAKGEKVYDDVQLLKKSVKRKDKKKENSAKFWDEKNKQEKSQQIDKQKKRTHNIQSKLQGRIERKLGNKPKPKPKKRPGFEGKKKHFINKH